jgi:acetyl esterase/lipase
MGQNPNTILKILKLARADQQVLRLFFDPPRKTGSLDASKVKRSLQPEEWMVDGFRLLTILVETSSPMHVIYFPGGAYLLEATSAHRKFAEKLVRKYGLSVTLIDYPKSPENTYQETHDLVLKAYIQLVERYPDQEFSLIGDSAGGGLALVLRQSLRDQGSTPLPRKTVLISPWLDLNLTHPDIPAYETREFILPMEGLKHAANLYMGDGDRQDPRHSPLYGDLNDLGNIKLVFGSEEVFYPDCRMLINKIEQSRCTQIEWEVGEGLVHAWPLFPFPESRAALERIASFLLAE